MTIGELFGKGVPISEIADIFDMSTEEVVKHLDATGWMLLTTGD